MVSAGWAVAADDNFCFELPRMLGWAGARLYDYVSKLCPTMFRPHTVFDFFFRLCVDLTLCSTMFSMFLPWLWLFKVVFTGKGCFRPQILGQTTSVCSTNFGRNMSRTPQPVKSHVVLMSCRLNVQPSYLPSTKWTLTIHSKCAVRIECEGSHLDKSYEGEEKSEPTEANAHRAQGHAHSATVTHCWPPRESKLYKSYNRSE